MFYKSSSHGQNTFKGSDHVTWPTDSYIGKLLSVSKLSLTLLVISAQPFLVTYWPICTLMQMFLRWSVQFIGLACSHHFCFQRLEGFVVYQRTWIALTAPSKTPTSHIALPCLLTLCPLSHYSSGLRGCVAFAEITGKVYVIEPK